MPRKKVRLAKILNHALPALTNSRPLERTSLGTGGGILVRPIATNEQLAIRCPPVHADR